MKKIHKNLIVFILSFLVFSPILVSCTKTQSTIQLQNCAIMHEEEFGGVYINKTISQFNDLGFEYGDSVKVVFSNGFSLNDIPYYNGYYTQTGEPLLVAYPGYPYIKVAINNGDDLWDVGDLGLLSSNEQERYLLWNVAQLESNTTASVILNERGKYLDIQEARDIHYLDDRTLYPSDEIFANFRSLKGGNLKENLLYRSASPCDNQHNRATYVDKLIKNADVKYIIDLADTDEKIQTYLASSSFNSPYFASLYDEENVENDSVVPLALNMNFGSQYFKEQVVKAMVEIASHDGPFLIHCTEGKDRTGFVCMLLEAFAGASYMEIVEDYMMTYFNYYAITKAFDLKRYNTIVDNVLNPLIKEIIDEENVDIKTANLEEYATRYLLSNNMTQSQINALKNRICNENL